MSSGLRVPALAILAGALVAAPGAIGVAAGGRDGHVNGPDGLDPWLVVFGVGLFLALFAVPFLIHRRSERNRSDDAVFSSWDRAVGIWGTVALVVGAPFVLAGLGFGWDTATAIGALATVGTAVCAIVIGVILAFIVG